MGSDVPPDFDATRKVQLPMWRSVILIVGLIGLTSQAALFVAFWLRQPIGRDPIMFGKWAFSVHLSFIVALPCLFAGKGAYRWWLLASSVVLFVICFYIVVIE